VHTRCLWWWDCVSVKCEADEGFGPKKKIQPLGLNFRHAAGNGDGGNRGRWHSG
jgi:hypothetical protein